MRGLTTVILVCLACIGKAQVAGKLSSYYNIKDGLSNNNIYCITQDTRSFLWIGTKEGLNRFDGFTFAQYFSENNKTGLAHNAIWDILEYKTGQLLIATGSGLSVLNTFTGKFENEKINSPAIKAGSGTLISSLFKDNQSNIWINHSGELDVLDSNLKYIHRFTDLDWAKSLKGVLVRFEKWYMDKQNRLWLPTDTSGIQVIDFAQKKIFNKRNNPEHISILNDQYIRSFFLDESNQIIWLGSWGKGLIKYDLATGKQQQLDFGNGHVGEDITINSIVKTPAGNLLCTIGSFVYEIDPATLTYQLTSVNQPRSMPLGGEIESKTIYAARNGHYWIGDNSGLSDLYFTNPKNNEFTLTNPVSYAACSDISISSSGNLYSTFNNGTLMIINKDRKNTSVYNIPGATQYFIAEVCEDHNNRVWIGRSDGLYIFDTSHKNLYQPSFLHPDLAKFIINVIYCDHDGDLWIATRSKFGIYRYESSKKKFEKIDNPIFEHFEKLGSNSRISDISEDENGRIWMISRLGGGIASYDKKTNEWKLYPVKTDQSKILETGLTSLYTGDDNNLWLSNFSGDGLIKYNYRTDSVEYFKRTNGLLSDYILNTCIDTSGNLWLTTEYGITKFNLANQKATSGILVNNDSAYNYFEREMLFDPITNNVVLGLSGRLMFIPVNKTQRSTQQLLPVIDRITVNNKLQLIDPGYQSLQLGYKENYISIDFTAVQFMNADKIRFAYQLSGIDKEWKYANASRSVQYAALAPGHYTFTIKAADENGAWGDTVSTFSFTINPPFWQTWWFRITVLLLVSAIITFFVRRRISVIRHEAEMKQKISETEMMALRAQMNPHFIFNCLNAIDNLVQTNQKEKATTYLARFAKLIRSVLDSSKNNVVPFQNDYESLQLYLQMEQFRCNNKFSYELDADEELLHSDYKLPPLIVQPFVENAIHHGLLNKQVGERKLSVSASLENDTIKYTIVDNGVGRVKAQEIKERNRPEHQSYGINITKERVHLYNQNGKTQDISITDLVEDGKPAGTRVEIRLKVHENNNPVYA